jgi:DNA-binding NarL/FixJ family response regulator
VGAYQGPSVLVSANHPIVWQSIVHVLQAQGCLSVTGCSFDEASGPPSCHVDVALCIIDPRSADLAGLPKWRSDIQRVSPDAKLICLFLSEDDAAVVSAIQAGASGIIAGAVRDGDFNIADILSAIDRVSAGEFVMSAPMALRLALLHAKEVAPPPPAKEDCLTQREQEVLRLLAQGKTNRDIARCLSLSEHTVRSHLRGIMQKLQVSNRVQAAALAWSGDLAQGMAARGGTLSGNFSG